jgi:hypothetical protein
VHVQIGFKAPLLQQHKRWLGGAKARLSSDEACTMLTEALRSLLHRRAAWQECHDLGQGKKGSALSGLNSGGFQYFEQKWMWVQAHESI